MKIEKILEENEKLKKKNTKLKTELNRYKNLFGNSDSPALDEIFANLKNNEDKRRQEFELAMNDLKAKQIECDMLISKLQHILQN